MGEAFYRTGEIAALGDTVEVDGRIGRIVACLESCQYSPEFPKEEWSYLGTGVLWEGDDIGVVHVSSLSEPGVVFIKRKRED